MSKLDRILGITDNRFINAIDLKGSLEREEQKEAIKALMLDLIDASTLDYGTQGKVLSEEVLREMVEAL